MKYFFVLFVLILISNSLIYCFEPDDFCLKENKKIRNCAAFNCGTKYCSYDKQTCKDFFVWAKLMNKYTKELIVYNMFMSRIKKCEIYDYSNQWSHRFHFG